MKEIFKKSSPEEQGLSSKNILKFLKFAEERSLDLHSLIILRNNRLLCEAYFAPFSAETLHRMFSVTKSFVSAAVGCLYGEGRIDLDQPIINYFPEYEKICDPITKTATIRNLLKMQSPHDKTTFKQIKSDSWTETFFAAKAAKIPGTVFSYDTSATHTLTALVEKITGKPFLDYLRDKFLTEAGFSDNAYCMTDPEGVSQGGSGLMAKPLDIAIFANIILNKGRLGNRQVIPEEYVAEASKKQSETFVKGAFFEETKGYGYQFWLLENDGFMCYGIGGQLALIYPKYNLVIAATADVLGNKSGITELIGGLEAYIVKNLSDEPLQNDPTSVSALGETCRSLKLNALKADPNVSHKNFKNQTYDIEANPYGLKALTININGENTGILELITEKSSYTLPFGLGFNAEGRLPLYGDSCQSSAVLPSENELIILSRLTGEEPGKIYFQIGRSENNAATLLTRKTPLDGFPEFDRTYILTPKE